MEELNTTACAIIHHVTEYLRFAGAAMHYYHLLAETSDLFCDETARTASWTFYPREATIPEEHNVREDDKVAFPVDMTSSTLLAFFHTQFPENVKIDTISIHREGLPIEVFKIAFEICSRFVTPFMVETWYKPDWFETPLLRPKTKMLLYQRSNEKKDSRKDGFLLDFDSINCKSLDFRTAWHQIAADQTRLWLQSLQQGDVDMGGRQRKNKS